MTAPERTDAVDVSPVRTLVTATVAGLVVIGVIAIAYVVPLPSVGHLRTWADSVGPGFVVLFFLAYALITVGPIPRTAFTVSSGVLFGPVVGFVGAMTASTIAALIAFVIVRRLGGGRVRGLLDRPVVASVEYRLRRRGWLAVGSLRMIAACPFSVLNYCAGLSVVPMRSFLLGTVVGMAPGTASIVFVGDALTGRLNPVTLAFSATLFLIGLAGLVLDVVLDRRERAAVASADAEINQVSGLDCSK